MHICYTRSVAHTCKKQIIRRDGTQYVSNELVYFHKQRRNVKYELSTNLACLLSEIFHEICPHARHFKHLTEDISQGQIFFILGPF